MELSQLKYFCAVAENLHVTKTAKQFHIAQPALTQSIKRLEKELGVPLFLNKGRNIVLSEYGSFAYQQVAPVISTLEQLPALLDKKKEKESCTLRLNVRAASTLITQSIIEYKHQYGQVDFQLFQHQAMNTCDFEIFTTESGRLKEDDETFVFKEELLLGVGKQVKLNRSEVDLRDLKELDFISLSNEKELRQICDMFCLQAGFQPNIVFETDSYLAVQNCIRADIGVGFIPEFTWGEVKPSLMDCVRISYPKCERDIVVVYHPRGINHEVAKHYFEFLKGFFKQVKERSR